MEKLLSAIESGQDETRGFAAKLVASYFNDWSRFHLTTVLTVDYAMPGIDGLEMIRRIASWPGRRILLTGEADAAVAIAAFNQGLIQKFIPKSTPNLYRALKVAYEEMHRDVCEHMGYLIRPTLSSEQNELLQSPDVVTALENKVRELEWSEYIVIAKPFGILGISHNGPLQWIQIETDESLIGLAELLEVQNYSVNEIDQVRRSMLLANMELYAELRIPGRAPLVDAEQISASPHVLIGVFDLLDVPVLTANAYGIDDLMTPLEILRSQLRDLVVAHQFRQSASTWTSDVLKSTPFSSSTTVEIALNTLMETSQQSFVHKEALEVALAESNYSAEVRHLIASYTPTTNAQNG